MRILQRRDANKLREQMAQRPVAGLGDYGESTPYDESEVFRAATPGQLQVNAEGEPIPDPFANPVSFTTYAFALSSTSGNAGSVQLLSYNGRRQLLLIQNLSSGSDLFVNFGTAAGVDTALKLTNGAGVFFDEVCPNNAIFVFFNAATPQPGVIIEGSPVY